MSSSSSTFPFNRYECIRRKERNYGKIWRAITIRNQNESECIELELCEESMEIIKINNKHRAERCGGADESSIMSRSLVKRGWEFDWRAEEFFVLRIPTCYFTSTQRHLTDCYTKLSRSRVIFSWWLKSTNISRWRDYTKERYSRWVVMAIPVINFQHHTRKCAHNILRYLSRRVEH